MVWRGGEQLEESDAACDDLIGFECKALACAARSAASKPTRYAGGVNRLYKTTLPPDTCDCSGRKGSEMEGW